MAIVFQYGSNMSSARLNSKDRLAGSAAPIGIARTTELYELGFPVWSVTNNCAAVSIEPSRAGRAIYGVLYNVPDELIPRETSGSRKSLDAIEGEGSNYVRKNINVVREDGSTETAITYVAKSPGSGQRTSLEYAEHILRGLREATMPADYCKYVTARILASNPTLKGKLETHTTELA